LLAVMTDADLYRRGTDTLIASWEAYAHAATGAALLRPAGVAIAIFPNEPERSIYNNALLQRDLAAADRDAALGAMEAAYAAAGVRRFAAWVLESDAAMRGDLERHGYVVDTSTRAMGMTLDDIRQSGPIVEIRSVDWSEHVRLIGVSPNLLSGIDRAAFSVRVARLDGEDVATAIAFDLHGDRGIYNVGTLEHARRRGLATALTTDLVHEAAARGCRTASVQSTAMAEGLYAAIGFRDLGRILEYVPSR
jgi:ribosomal protein S18 acetylase RimI-like enzyme